MKSYVLASQPTNIWKYTNDHGWSSLTLLPSHPKPSNNINPQQHAQATHGFSNLHEPSAPKSHVYQCQRSRHCSTRAGAILSDCVNIFSAHYWPQPLGFLPSSVEMLNTQKSFTFVKYMLCQLFSSPAFCRSCLQITEKMEMARTEASHPGKCVIKCQNS